MMSQGELSANQSNLGGFIMMDKCPYNSKNSPVYQEYFIQMGSHHIPDEDL